MTFIKDARIYLTFYIEPEQHTMCSVHGTVKINGGDESMQMRSIVYLLSAPVITLISVIPAALDMHFIALKLFTIKPLN